MFSRILNRQQKTGAPPGTLIHIGRKHERPARISVIDYNEADLLEKELPKEQVSVFKETANTSWINIDGIHDVEVIGHIGKDYGIHSLVLEDVVNTLQRPKVEEYDQVLFIVLKMLHYNEAKERIEPEQVCILLGPNFVLSFQEKEGDIFDPVRQRIRSGNSRIRKQGASYLAYALLDTVVDHYFHIMEKLEDRIEKLEDEVVSNPSDRTLIKINHLKRELILLRKSIWPVREVLSEILHSDSPLIQKKVKIYLRDVYDHAMQVMDSLSTYVEIVNHALDIYLTSVSNKMNEVMKVLTVIATIFIPLTFIAGVYGMNFEYMPELTWKWAYPILLTLMLAVAIVMLFYFRKRRWL